MNLRPTDELDYETTRVRHAASPLFGYARIWTSKATTCGPANNRNCGRSPLSRERWPSCPSHDQVYIRPREFVRNFRRTVIPSFRPPRIDLEVARFGPTQFAEPLHENSEPWPANRGGSRTQESEADWRGLIYMAKAGYDPEAAVAFWERFAAFNKQAGGGGTPWFLRTHPLDETRIKVTAWNALATP